MPTGSVNPVTPSQPTVVITAGTVSVSSSFIPSDALLLYNAGTAVVFVQLGATNQTITAVAPTGTVVGGMPIPPAAEHLLGTPSVSGNQEVQITQIGAVTASGTSLLYITPVEGTEY